MLLGIIAFQACNSNKTNNTDNTDNTDKKVSLTNTPCSSCGNSDKRLEGVISGDLLDTLSKAYLADVCKSYVSLTGPVPADGPSTDRVARKRDALSMFFDLEKIKTFISKMENSVCKSGCDTSIKLGIRFYYIKYQFGADRENELSGVPREYEGKHALVMVPVYQKKSDMQWYDFYFSPDAITSGPCVFSRTIIDLDGGYNTFGLLGGDGDGTNHGGIGPPPDPGTFPTNN